MVAKITFTQKEESALRATLVGNPFDHKDLQSLLSKMEKARDKSKEVKFSGISVANLITLARERLGDRLTLPDNTTADWFIKMQRAINTNGITEEIAIKALKVADTTWTSSIWIETLIYSLGKLAAGVAQSTLPFNQNQGQKKAVGFTPTKTSGWGSRLKELEMDGETQ